VLIVGGRFGIVGATTAARRSASHACRSMLLLNTAADSDHDILSLDPAMVIVKAVAFIAGWHASGRQQMSARTEPVVSR